MSIERTIYERELQDEAENLSRFQDEKANLEAELRGLDATRSQVQAELDTVNRNIARSEAITETVKRLMDMLE